MLLVFFATVNSSQIGVTAVLWSCGVNSTCAVTARVGMGLNKEEQVGMGKGWVWKLWWDNCVAVQLSSNPWSVETSWSKRLAACNVHGSYGGGDESNDCISIHSVPSDTTHQYICHSSQWLSSYVIRRQFSLLCFRTVTKTHQSVHATQWQLSQFPFNSS